MTGGPSILERTDKWVDRRKTSRCEPEQRTREQIEEDIFQQKVEKAKAKLSTTKCSAKAPRVPDLGKAYAWEKNRYQPRRKGEASELPTSPPQKKHYGGAILQSNVTQGSAGIAGPQPEEKDDEMLRGPRTSREWNLTQMQGSKYGFTPTVEERAPPRVKIIAPDKVTGVDKAPWLVECHPEHSRKETLDHGIGRSKKHFPGKGFEEGVQWPEDKEQGTTTYQQRQDIYGTRGHYRGKPDFVADAAGCPSAVPSSSNIKVSLSISPIALAQADTCLQRRSFASSTAISREKESGMTPARGDSRHRSPTMLRGKLTQMLAGEASQSLAPK